MIFDKYISENELEIIRRKYGQKIIKYPFVQDEIKKYYEKLGLKYPNSCINNFRDSWFHYRKIWQEHSYYSIISQISTLDEHLQRAERDAIVNLLQMISQKIEFWYLANSKKTRKMIKVGLNKEFSYELGTIKFDDCYSLTQYWKSFAGDDIQATFALIYTVGEELAHDMMCYREMQNIIHEIKNCSMEIRLGASEIDRLNEPGEYLEYCRTALNRIVDSEYFKLYFYFIQMYDVVMAHLDYFFQSMEDKK